MKRKNKIIIEYLIDKIYNGAGLYYSNKKTKLYANTVLFDLKILNITKEDLIDFILDYALNVKDQYGKLDKSILSNFNNLNLKYNNNKNNNFKNNNYVILNSDVFNEEYLKNKKMLFNF